MNFKIFCLLLSFSIFVGYGLAFPPPGGINTTIATPIPEKIIVYLKADAVPNAVISVEYQRNQQTFLSQAWSIPNSVDLARNQPTLKYEFTYISMFYNIILANPAYESYPANSTFYYSSAQMAVLTVNDQIDLNEQQTTYPVKVNVILGASKFALPGTSIVHMGVLVYTDTKVNYVVPYLYAQEQ